MNNALDLTLFEKILIAAGLLFFANAVWLAAGGGFTILYVAKGMYLTGIVILASQL
ncbi:MAG: hypothetical protein WD335_00515 [Candidatus Paceibacterota bacterium]